MEEANDFERKGILTSSAFESVVSREDAFTADEFLKILAHLRIIAEFSRPGDQEKRYFLPCVLNHVSESTGEELETDIIPLTVKFKCKHCPKGLFGVLVTHLMNPEADEREDGSISFTLREDKIFKDQVSFYVSSLYQQDEISLALHSLFLEVNFYPEGCKDRKTPISSVCSQVRKVISQSIASSLKDLHYNRANVEPVMCIKCADCSQLHQVKEGKVIFCERHRRTCDIPPQAECWWNSGGQSCLCVKALSCTAALPCDVVSHRMRLIYLITHTHTQQIVPQLPFSPSLK